MFKRQIENSNSRFPGEALSGQAAFRTKGEIARVRQNGRHLAELFEQISRRIEPGITGLDIEATVRAFIEQRDLAPALAGYRDYPSVCCVNPGLVAVHGIPDDVPIPSGQLVTVDVAVERAGWFADAAWTFAVGPVDADHARLLKGAYAACMAGIGVLKDGVTVGYVAQTIRRAAEGYGLAVQPECCGHGVGRALHEPPTIPYHPNPQHIAASSDSLRNRVLRSGQIITIEPVVSLADDVLVMREDGHGLVAAGGSSCAQFEHTVSIEHNRARILTGSRASDVDFPPFF